MIDLGKINEAENILLDSIDYTNNNEVIEVALFYQYLSEKDNKFLENNNYTKEEVLSGFKQLLMKSGYIPFSFRQRSYENYFKLPNFLRIFYFYSSFARNCCTYISFPYILLHFRVRLDYFIIILKYYTIRFELLSPTLFRDSR